MAKKKIEESVEEEAPKKGYSYEPYLEGCNIGAHKVITLSDKVSQSDLKKLYEMGVKGIIKH